MVMNIPLFERFFRAAAGLDVDKDDKALSRFVTEGELNDIRSILPRDIAALVPESASVES